MRPLAFCLALLAAGLGMERAEAAPVPAADVPAMVGGAELIAVGRVGGIAVQRRPNGIVESFTLSVERVLKGDGTIPRQVSVQLSLSASGFGTVGDRQYGMFFLKHAPGTAYVAVDAYHPALVASPTTGSAVSGDALSGVTRELAAVLTTPAAALVDPISGLHSMVRANPAVQAEHIYSEATAALRTLPSGSVGVALRPVAASRQAPGRLWAITGLLALTDPAPSTALKVALVDSVKATLLDPPPELAYTVDNLAGALQSLSDAPGAVPGMASLLASKSVEVRRAAALVLSQIGTEPVIAPLANIALNDKDQDVRYYAVLGLSEASGLDNAPTWEAFRQDEGGVTRFWHHWTSPIAK